jgi:hypothetical protein
MSSASCLQPLVDLVVCLREEVRELQEQLDSKQTRLRLAEASLEMLRPGEEGTGRSSPLPDQDAEMSRTEDLAEAQASEVCCCGNVKILHTLSKR